ncbi:MAG: hypothetical protein ACRENP_05840 [Longimicrobiales bacterium]
MTRDDAQAAEANRLYWNQAASVGEIANQLGISRRALYEVLQPRPAGIACPKCGTDGVFVNRSAQAAGMARCPSCGTEMHVASPEDAEAAPAAPPMERANGGHPFRLRFGIGSAALMGVVVGAIATLLLTQRE